MILAEVRAGKGCDLCADGVGEVFLVSPYGHVVLCRAHLKLIWPKGYDCAFPERSSNPATEATAMSKLAQGEGDVAAGDRYWLRATPPSPLSLTKAQAKALMILSNGAMTAMEFAGEMWPDSPGWGVMKTVGNGRASLGMGMHRAAGGFLGKLQTLGLVDHPAGKIQWAISNEGVLALRRLTVATEQDWSALANLPRCAACGREALQFTDGRCPRCVRRKRAIESRKIELKAKERELRSILTARTKRGRPS